LNSCLYCKFADWQKTAAGRKHPSGDGKCTWEVKIPVLALARGWSFPNRPNDPPTIGYGFINRKKPFEKCPTFQPIQD
jgi:hypothetical protein